MNNITADNSQLIEAVARGMWEAGEAPCRWGKLTNAEQDEWREMAQGGLKAAAKWAAEQKTAQPSDA